jgi:choline kinase
MRAVLLAAGLGSRLGDIGEGRPKCLALVAGRSLLAHHIDSLRAAGISDITVVAGHLADKVIGEVGDHVRIVVNSAYESTNSLASLNMAAEYLRGDAFVMQNADVLYAEPLIQRFVSHPAPNACLIDAARRYSDAEYRVATRDGRIERYERGLPYARSVGESAQLLKVSAADADAFLDRIAELATGSGASGFPLQAYPVLQERQGLFPVYTAGLPWFEIDVPDDLLRCRAALETPLPDSTLEEHGQTAGQGIFDRTSELLKTRSLPWRLRWLPRVLSSARRQPLHALRQVPQLYRGDLSFAAFDLQAEGPRILKEVMADSEASGLSPMLMWGTLLGHIRDNGLIRGDQDLDLGVLEADAHRLPALRDALLARGYRVRIENPNKLSMIPPGLPKLFVDIDVITEHASGWAIANTEAFSDRTLNYVFPQHVFASQKETSFVGVARVWTPGDPAAVLRAIYGDWKVKQPKLDYRFGPMNTEVALHAPVLVPAPVPVRTSETADV